MKSVFYYLMLILPLLVSCSRSPDLPALAPADSLRIVQDNLQYRAGVDNEFRTDPDSPFARDTSVKFTGLTWYPVNPRCCAVSMLHRYAEPETVTIMGTKGEPRKQLRYGYFAFSLPDGRGSMIPVRLNAYTFIAADARRFAAYPHLLNVWFTDSTTGTETYHVGRYLNIGDEDADPSHLYVLDFNKAYNPYCAYSDMYSCAIPDKADVLPLALRAGEKNYHE